MNTPNKTTLWIINSMTGDTLYKGLLSTDSNDFKEGKVITIDGTNYLIVERYTDIFTTLGAIVINLRVIGHDYNS